jgi:hypothetical protein
MKVGCKNVSIFINGPVLNYSFSSIPDLYQLIQAAIQKIDLQLKAPAGHVLIKIIEVRIMLYIFKMGNTFLMFGKQFSKSGFTGTNVSGNSNMFWFFRFRHITHPDK